MADNKAKIKALAVEMLKNAQEHIEANIEKALNCGALDPDSWDENCDPMILPKTILIAALESEAEQYKCPNTRFEKEMRKDVKNLKCFI